MICTYYTLIFILQKGNFLIFLMKNLSKRKWTHLNCLIFLLFQNCYIKITINWFENFWTWQIFIKWCIYCNTCNNFVNSFHKLFRWIGLFLNDCKLLCRWKTEWIIVDKELFKWKVKALRAKTSAIDYTTPVFAFSSCFQKSASEN